MNYRRFFLPSLAASVALVASLTATVAGAQTALSCDGQPATIVGTAQNDVLEGTPGVDVIMGLQGDDLIMGLGGDDIVCAGKGNDTIYGGAGFDIIFAAQGNDAIYAAAGESAADRADRRGARMFGGAGNDTIHGSNRWDRMQGGAGADTLFGYEGRDWMRAGADNDVVDGGPGIDDLHGGNGRDVIELTNGDSVKGGAGIDTCNVADGTATSMKSCEEAAGTVPETTTPTPVAPGGSGVAVVSCNASAETVQLRNDNVTTITLTGWTIEDEGPNFAGELDMVTIAPGQTVTLLFGDGPNQPGTIRIFDRDIWNNAGDTAFLKGPDGAIVSQLECD